MAQRVVGGLLGDPQQCLLLGGGQRPDRAGVEGDGRGVRPVQDLRLGAQGGHEAVLVQGGGAQLHDDGAELVGGLGGERGDLRISSLARPGWGSTRAAAAWAVSRREKSFWDTASWSSWAIRARSPAKRQFAAAFEQPGVGQGDGGVVGEDAQQVLVLLGEAGAASGCGHTLLARKTAPRISSPSTTGMPMKSFITGWARGHPREARGVTDVGQPLRGGLLQYHREHAVLSGQRADRLHCSSLTPSTTNWAKPPWSSGTPRAAYSAPSSSRAEVTMVWSTSRTSSRRFIARTAALTASIPPRGCRGTCAHRTRGG